MIFDTSNPTSEMDIKPSDKVFLITERYKYVVRRDSTVHSDPNIKRTFIASPLHKDDPRHDVWYFIGGFAKDSDVRLARMCAAHLESVAEDILAKQKTWLNTLKNYFLLFHKTPTEPTAIAYMLKNEALSLRKEARLRGISAKLPKTLPPLASAGFFRNLVYPGPTIEEQSKELTHEEVGERLEKHSLQAEVGSCSQHGCILADGHEGSHRLFDV